MQGTTFLVIALIVLLLLTFIISGAEVALFSLNDKDVNMLKTRQQVSAKRIVNLLKEPKEVYASLLIAGTFVNISIIVLFNFLINRFISFDKMGGVLEILSKVIVIAFVLVFFGKIFPKVWATQNNLRFAYGCSFVIESLHLLLRRISKWIVSLADGIGKRASQEEKNIMKGIVKFGNISVKQIMRSRLEVSGIDYNSSFSDLIKRVEELHYSRLPVYNGSLDEVVGIINTKDLIPFLSEAENLPASPSPELQRSEAGQPGYDWHPLMRQPYFVPELKLIEDLLKDFQQKRIHFAVVVDEFGGTSGIVTMEDVLEEIIGDIKDEFDGEESGNSKLDDNNYIFEGKTMIHDMCKTMQLPMDTFDRVKGESESLGGLVLEVAGEFPVMDSVIHCGDFDFTILQADNNRIQLVKVTIKPKQ